MNSSSFGKVNSSAYGKNDGSRFEVLIDEYCEATDMIASNVKDKAKGKAVVKGPNVLAKISNLMEKGPKVRDYYKVNHNLSSRSLPKGKQSKNDASIVNPNISSRYTSFGTLEGG
ncbi:hypothetical protein ACOSP7_009794 [Xanthoceras sorbifolium]